MNQVFQLLGLIGTKIVGDPRSMQIAFATILGAGKTYRQLSPAAKAAVDSIMIQAAEYLVNAALGDVLGWTKSQAITLGLSNEAASVAETGVRRIAEVGIKKAFEEIRG